MKVSRQKSLEVFAVRETFLYENLRWHYSHMDLRGSMWDSAKVFCEALCMQLAANLFCLKTFMVYSIFI